jgi:ribosomal protein S18 acetylase RimI-like enzyme
MDGIVVRGDRRGEGIVTTLLESLFALARSHGLTSVRLEVVDTNPRAQALYERAGFGVTNTEWTPYLRRLMGFGASSEMVAQLEV